MRKPPLLLTCLSAGLLCGVSAFAGSFTNDFSSPAPLGFTLNREAAPTGTDHPVIVDGHLVLTWAELSEYGSIVLDDLDPGGTVGSFKATFKVRIGGGTSTPADGLAFYFGSDIDSYAVFGEEGPDPSTSGVAVCFDTYDNVDGDPSNGVGEAPAIDIKVNGVTIAHKMVDVFFLLNDTFVPINIELLPNGVMNVDMKGTVIFTNVVLTGFAPITAGRFAIGARTGGASENNWIDDLGITTTLAGPPVAPTIAVQPASQTIAEYGSVTFSVLPNGTPPFSFQWVSDKVTLTDATNATLTLNNVLSTANGAKFHVTVGNAQGSVTSDDAVLTVTADTTAPTITSASGSRKFDRVLLVFSEPVTITGATFACDNGLAIASATQYDATRVVLRTGTQTPGTLYTLTVNGVKDLAGAPNTIAADTKAPFNAFVWAPGFLTFEYWGGINTAPGSVADLTADQRYIDDMPDSIGYMSAFNTRTIFPDNSHEYYGDREVGFLIPKETADYYFFISSDDASQFWISTDANPDNLIMIAEEAGCCNAFQEPGAAQTGGPMHLVAGQRYAVMALHKEGTGGDYCQVAWRKEGDSTPAASLTPIPGDVLATYADPGAATINIAQQPADFATTENKTATFSVAATGSPPPVAYQWQRAEPATPTAFVDIAGARSANYTTPILKRATDNGAKYRAMVIVPGKSLASAAATLTVTIDNVAPQVAQVLPGINLKSATVTFSEPMDAASAGDYKNYSIPGLTVTAAKVIKADTVTITTSPQAENTTYIVTVGAKVTDTAIPANPMDPAANSKAFVSVIGLAGVVTWEAFNDIGGSGTIAALTGSAKYPTSPDQVHLVPWFEGFTYYERLINYGVRMAGFVTPKTSGNYVFFMATDDNGELWLSTDDSPANTKLIARETGWSGARNWVTPGAGDATTKRSDTFAGTQWPAGNTINLTAGQRYYLELLYSEGGGGNNGAVNWKREADGDPADGSQTSLAGDVLSTAVSADVLTKVSLPVALASPLGSGDVNRPGFNARVWQANQDNGANTLGNANFTYRAEQELAGAVPSKTAPGAADHVNYADLTGAVGGIFPISTYINWNYDMGTGGAGVEIGAFTSLSTPSRPDQPVPGLPGTGSTTAHVNDNVAAEVIGYVEFPTAGIYAMGVNSDDGFKVTGTDQVPKYSKAVLVEPGSSVSGIYYAQDGSTLYGLAFKPIDAVYTGKLVAIDPYNGCSAPTNPDALRGNIALITRGVCQFSLKVQYARLAGAIAAIIVNSRDIDSGDGMWPIGMGMGDAGYQDIPGVMMTKPDGVKLKAALDAGENVIVTIAPDTTPWLGEFDAGRGSDDTLFAFNVLQAGVYPLRCVWFQGGGGANLEWYCVDTTGKRALLNDTAAGGLKSYRARTFAPVTPLIKSIALDGANVKITFDGTLQHADTVKGTWSDVSSTSPYSTAVSGKTMKFYRARQ